MEELCGARQGEPPWGPLVAPSEETRARGQQSAPESVLYSAACAGATNGASSNTAKINGPSSKQGSTRPVVPSMIVPSARACEAVVTPSDNCNTGEQSCSS